MGRFHMPMTKNNRLRMKHDVIGSGYAPSLMGNKEGGSIGVSANQPVGIISPPPRLVSEGGRIRKEYARHIENIHPDPMNIRGDDLLDKISFNRKEKNAHKKNNIKFVF
jgi:hypothetical protein